MTHKSFKPFTVEEHERFVQALEKFGGGNTGKEWKDITDYVGGSRTVQEVKLHGHEYFLGLQACCAKEASKEFELDYEKWSAEEDYIFEQALAAYNEGDEQRWNKIAALLPGKTPEDVRRRYEKLLFDMGRIEKGEQVVMKFNKAETVAKDDGKTTVEENKTIMDEEDADATDEEAEPSKEASPIQMEMAKETCNAGTSIIDQGASTEIMEEGREMDVDRMAQSDDIASIPSVADELPKKPTLMELASENDDKMDVVRNLLEPPAAVPYNATASAPLTQKKEPVGLLLNPRSFSSRDDTANNTKDNIQMSSIPLLPSSYISASSVKEDITTKKNEPALPLSNPKPLEEVQLPVKETPAPTTKPSEIAQQPQLPN